MIAAQHIVAGALGLPEVAADASIETLPAWDSLGHMRIVLAVEAARGRTLSAEEIFGLVDVAAVERALAST